MFLTQGQKPTDGDLQHMAEAIAGCLDSDSDDCIRSGVCRLGTGYWPSAGTLLQMEEDMVHRNGWADSFYQLCGLVADECETEVGRALALLWSVSGALSLRDTTHSIQTVALSNLRKVEQILEGDAPMNSSQESYLRGFLSVNYGRIASYDGDFGQERLHYREAEQHFLALEDKIRVLRCRFRAVLSDFNGALYNGHQAALPVALQAFEAAAQNLYKALEGKKQDALSVRLRYLEVPMQVTWAYFLATRNNPAPRRVLALFTHLRRIDPTLHQNYLVAIKIVEALYRSARREFDLAQEVLEDGPVMFGSEPHRLFEEARLVAHVLLAFNTIDPVLEGTAVDPERLDRLSQAILTLHSVSKGGQGGAHIRAFAGRQLADIRAGMKRDYDL